MNNYLNKRNGRDIVPSARPSIHSHKNCPFGSTTSMGGYGLTTQKNRSTPPNTSRRVERNEADDNGSDEVDNILSKPLDNEYQRRLIPLRRNSYHIQDDSSNSDDVVLAKSLPTSLPSYSHCSSSEWVQDDYRNKLNSTGNTSSQSDIFDTSQTSRFSGLNQTPSPQYRSVTQERNRNNTTSNKTVLWAPLSLLVAVIGVIGYNNQILGMKHVTIYDESRFYNDISNLGEKYKINHDSLLQVQTGISTISKREDTGSFIFVYNSKLQNFNDELFDDLLDNISQTAAKFLRNDSTTVRHLVVESSDLNMHTTAQLINRYQGDVTRMGVMLVKEIDRIPSSLAMAFHYYCDEYNPLVKKSAIFFTLDLARCQNNSELPSVHAIIERCLTNKWNSVPSEKIKPLLTRVVSVVVDLTRA